MAQTTVGLKVGSTSLKFVELAHEKKKWRLKKLGIENLPFSEKEGGYLNDARFLTQKMKEIIKKYKLNPKKIVTGVGGESVAVRVIKVPYMKESELREAIRWEAEEHLPYPMKEITLDYQVLEKSLPGLREGEMSVLLVGVKNQTIDEYLQIFQQAGFCPNIVDVNSLALYNVSENIKMNTKEGVALLNIGHYITNLIILSEDRPFLVRDIKFGGHNITLYLVRILRINYRQAESLKRARSLSKMSEQLGGKIKVEEIEQIIRESLSDLVQDVVRSFEYFTSTKEGTAVQKVIMSGGVCLLEKVDTILSQELEVPVEKMDPFVNIEYQKPKFKELLPSFSPLFAIPVGLALRKITRYD